MDLDIALMIVEEEATQLGLTITKSSKEEVVAKFPEFLGGESIRVHLREGTLFAQGVDSEWEFVDWDGPLRETQLNLGETEIETENGFITLYKILQVQQKAQRSGNKEMEELCFQALLGNLYAASIICKSN